jgi:hypothetical protein
MERVGCSFEHRIVLLCAKRKIGKLRYLFEGGAKKACSTAASREMGKQVEEIAASRRISLRYVIVQAEIVMYRQEFHQYFLLPFLFLSI